MWVGADGLYCQEVLFIHGPGQESLGACGGPPRRHSGLLKVLKSGLGDSRKLWEWDVGIRESRSRGRR